MTTFDDNQLTLRGGLGRIANLSSDYMIFSWTGQILLFKNRDMSKRWEYQSTFYAIRDFKMKGGADGWMTYDGNVFNWEAYSVVNSVEKTTPNGEPEAGFRVFFRRPSTIPLKDFYD